MTCKGICTRYKAQKPVGTGRYASGQRRCQICEIFIKWEGLWCPCCGYRLRTKPRNLKYKAKLRARVEASAAEARASAAATSKPKKAAKPKAAKASKSATTSKKAAAPKSGAAKDKATKGEKKPCPHCNRLFVYPKRHAKNCKKNPAASGST